MRWLALALLLAACGREDWRQGVCETLNAGSDWSRRDQTTAGYNGGNVDCEAYIHRAAQ